MSAPLSLGAALRTAGWPAGIVALSVLGGLAGAQLVTAMVTPTYQARASVVVAAYAPGGSADTPASDTRTGGNAPGAAPTNPNPTTTAGSATPKASARATAKPSGSAQANPSSPASTSPASTSPASPSRQTVAPTTRPAPAGEPTGTAELPAYRATLSKMMVPTVARYAESTNVARATAAALHLPPEDVVGHIDATHEADVQVVTLTTTASTPEQAAAIANTAATILARQIADGGPMGRQGALYAEPFERAVPASAPLAPDPFLTTVFGGFLGLLAGIGLATLYRRMDDRLRTTEQIMGELGLVVLGSVPRVNRWQLRAGARMAYRRRRVARSIRTALASLTPVNDPPGRRILVTSSFADDGKTFVAGLLSLGLAEQRYHITLLEGQLRHPSLARHFPASSQHTVQRLLGADDELAASAGVSLRVLGAEPTDPEVSRALLRSKGFIHLVDTAASQSDVVVINGPGVLASGDITPLSAQADTVILVVRAGTTKAADARRAVEVLRRLNVPIVGVIVTDAVDSGVPRVRRPAAAPPTGSWTGSWTAPTPPAVELPPRPRHQLTISTRSDVRPPEAVRTVRSGPVEPAKALDLSSVEKERAEDLEESVQAASERPEAVGASAEGSEDTPERASSETSGVTVSS